MISTISLKRAEKIAKKKSNKIRVFVFTQEGCPSCQDLMDVAFPAMLKKFEEHFRIYEVKELPTFYPVDIPTAYFYIPNVLHSIDRVGSAPVDVMEKDFEMFVRMKDGGSSSMSGGVGDVISNITSHLGIKPCDGCKRRQEWLNRAFRFPKTLTGSFGRVEALENE